MDVVMIPFYNREDYLSITLEQLGKTAQHPDLYYLFVADFNFRRAVLPIANRWLQSHRGEILQIDRTQAQSPIKQSYALYMGYHRALALKPGLVFMIEDDIAVSNRFFEWHYKILEKPEIRLSIATKQRDVPYPIPQDMAGYIVRSDYQSLGVCWRPEALYDVLQLFKPAYWANPFQYLKMLYPQVVRDLVASQDGLIHKHIIAHNWKVGFPIYPRAFHFGLSGANRRLPRPTGSLKQKVAKVKAIGFDESALKAELLANGVPFDPFFYDSIPTKLHLEVTPVLELRP